MSTPTENERQPEYLNALIAYYIAASAIAVGVCNALSVATANVVDRWIPQLHTRLAWEDELYLTDLIFPALYGLCPGMIVGLDIWLVIAIWPEVWPFVKHPVRATILCASLAGACRLLMRLPGGFHDPQYWIVAVASTLFIGATYGFLTSIIVNTALRIHARFCDVGHD